MLVTQSCPTLCHPLDRSLPGSSVHGILRARRLAWVAIPFSRGSSQARDRTRVSHCGQILYCLRHQGSLFTMVHYGIFSFFMYFAPRFHRSRSDWGGGFHGSVPPSVCPDDTLLAGPPEDHLPTLLLQASLAASPAGTKPMQFQGFPTTRRINFSC